MQPVMNYDDTGQPKMPGLSPSLVGLVIGLSSAFLVYLWQWNVEISAATFVILGYTAWLWTHAHNHSVMRGVLTAELRALPLNALPRRTRRMLLDPGFWWNVIFGGTLVTGSIWYAGLKEIMPMFGLAAAWLMVAASLRFGLTLVRPSELCHRCGYDLRGHLASVFDVNQVIVCPECSARWSRSQLGPPSTTVDWRRTAA